MQVSLDFETRSECDLLKAGAWKYSVDPSTSILCTAWAVGDNEVLCTRYPLELQDLDELAQDDRVIFCANNVGFEFAIWHNILVKKFKFNPIPIGRWRCSAAKADTMALPRTLGAVAKALRLPFLKDEEGKRVMLKMCKPVTEAHRHLHGMWHETDEDFEILMAYCKDDVEVERALVNKIGFLPASEQAVWELDQKINMLGARVDLPLAIAMQKEKVRVCDRIKAKCIKKYGFSPSQVAKLKEFLKKHDVAIPTKKTWKTVNGEKKQVDTETLGGAHIKKLIVQDIPACVKKALIMRKEFATTSIAKAQSALDYEVDGIIRGQFRYHGANTGRWSGKGVQLQNMPRGDFDEKWVDDDLALACHEILAGKGMSEFGMSEMSLLKSCIRGMIIPREGYELTVFDFSQIEARGLAWLAGQQEVLDAFAAGKDLYKFTASQIYNIPYEEVTKDQRFIGKMASLALGYGGGVGAFTSMAANFGVRITDDEANIIKDDWRARNPKIVAFWKDLQRATIRAVMYGKTTKVGFLKFKYDNTTEYLMCRLPSGRKIYYYQPKVSEGKYGKTLKYMGSDQAKGILWGMVGTYGGKLSENVTQAMTADLLREGLLNIDGEGYSIVAHVHDEIIVETPSRANSWEVPHYDRIEKAMLRMPAWAEGLPVEADGFICTRYRK